MAIELGKQRIPGLQNQTVDETKSAPVFVFGLNNITLYVKKHTAGDSLTGVVTFEEADFNPGSFARDFDASTASWSLMSTLDVSTMTNDQATIHLVGSFMYVRARISTVIAGGTAGAGIDTVIIAS